MWMVSRHHSCHVQECSRDDITEGKFVFLIFSDLFERIEKESFFFFNSYLYHKTITTIEIEISSSSLLLLLSRYEYTTEYIEEKYQGQ